MHKVLCQRGRKGAGAYGQMRRANRKEDQLPKYESMSEPYYDFSKYRDDYDGPIKRWLRSRVGCPWNEVYSELRQIIKPDTQARISILKGVTDIKQMMASRYGGFYVDEESGILLASPDSPRGVTLRERVEKRFGAVRIRLPKDFLLLKLKGLWFECRMVRYQAHWQFAPVDVVFASQLICAHARDAYGEPYYCSRKRQLSRKELRARGLVNSKSAADCFLKVLGDDLIGRIRRSHGNPIRCWLQFRFDLWIEASAGQFLSDIKFSFGGMTPSDKPV